MTDLTIPAADQFGLAATEFPAATSASGVVLISPATGVKRSLYRRFGEFLATQGLTAVSWDWRGTGESRPRSLRGFSGTMRDWAQEDLAGVIAWAGNRYPDLPLFVAGHSFGGQAIGLAWNSNRLRAAVTIAAQSGYWGHWPRPQRYLYAFLWYLLMPGITRLCGFFPAGVLGLGEDLPRGVALEWSRWCRSPEYLGDWSGHQRLALPWYVLGFVDDPFAPPLAVLALHDHYSGPQTRRILAPGDVGLNRIGHFGFFRPEAEVLWRDVAEWLRLQAQG